MIYILDTTIISLHTIRTLLVGLYNPHLVHTLRYYRVSNISSPIYNLFKS